MVYMKKAIIVILGILLVCLAYLNIITYQNNDKLVENARTLETQNTQLSKEIAENKDKIIYLQNELEAAKNINTNKAEELRSWQKTVEKVKALLRP